MVLGFGTASGLLLSKPAATRTVYTRCSKKHGTRRTETADADVVVLACTTAAHEPWVVQDVATVAVVCTPEACEQHAAAVSVADDVAADDDGWEFVVSAYDDCDVVYVGLAENQ